jgi:hypothetical protein
VGALQQLQLDIPPACLIESVAFQVNNDTQFAQPDFSTVCSMVGQPIMLDAAQFGSLAHRVCKWRVGEPVHPSRVGWCCCTGQASTRPHSELGTVSRHYSTGGAHC